MEATVRSALRRQSVRYPIAGALLATGAPLGLLFMRRFVLRRRTGIRDEIRGDLATYAYLTTSTTLVFTVLGRAIGKYADRLAALSATDGLTGLLNARAFVSRLEHEIERSRRARSPLTLLLLDLDYLKALNDRHGHAAGDRALRQISHSMRREMRSIDAGGRLGGDEFALLAVGTDRAAADMIAARLQRTIVEQDRETGVGITASIGVVTFDPLHDQLVDASALRRSADTALYAAKRSGRNRVAVGRLEPKVNQTD